MVAVALVVFAVEMLRASVLPVAPLALLAAGGVAALVDMAVAGIITAAGGDAGHVTNLIAIPLFSTPLGLTAAGFAWLGWCLWSEPSVADGTRIRPLAAG